MVAVAVLLAVFVSKPPVDSVDRTMAELVKEAAAVCETFTVMAITRAAAPESMLPRLNVN